MEELEKVNGLSEELSETASEEESTISSEIFEAAKEVEEAIEEAEEESLSDDEAADDEAADDEAQTEEEEKKKKPFILEKSIIIAACILIATVIGFGVFFAIRYITTPSVEGVWRQTEFMLKGDDSSKQTIKKSGGEAIYYTFKNDGVLEIKTGTVTNKYNWSYISQDGKKVKEMTDSITIFDENNPYSSTNCKFTIDGNRLSERKLKIETSGENVFIYKFTSTDEETANSFKLDKDKSFKENKKLTGTWSNKASKMKITFKSDGTYHMDVTTSIQEGNYKLKDSTLELTYFYSGQEGSTGAIPFELKDGKLYIGTDEFEKTK